MTPDVDFTATNHYELLGVDPSEETKVIEEKVKQLRNAYHPDSNPDSNSKKFTRVNKAIDVLTDDEKREEYDENPTRLDISVKSTDVQTGDDVKLHVSNDSGKQVQYTVVTEEKTVVTDGNGDVTVSFESPGEKRIVAEKVDNGTQKYVDAETTIDVSQEEFVPLEMRVYSESGDLLTDTDNTLSVNEHGLITVHNGDSGNPVNDVRIMIDDVTKEPNDNSVSFIPDTAKTYTITCEKPSADNITYVPEIKTVHVEPEKKSIDLEVLIDDIKAQENVPVRTTIEGNPEDDVIITLPGVDAISDVTTSAGGTATIYIPDEGEYTITARKDSEKKDEELYESTSTTVTATSVSEETHTETKDTDVHTEETHTNPRTTSVSSTVQTTEPNDATINSETDLSPVTLTSAYTQTKQWTINRGVADVLYTSGPTGYLTKVLTIGMYFFVIYSYGEWISVNTNEMSAVISTMLTISFLIAVVIPILIPRIGAFVFGIYTILDVQETTVFNGYTAWELVMGTLTVISIILWYRYVYKQYPYTT